MAWVQAAGEVTQVTQPDQGLFQAIGYHILHGKILYRDVFDHKPPGVFFLNAGYFLTGNHSENTVVYWIMFFVLLQTFVFYKICVQLFKNNLQAFFSTLVFIPAFFSRDIFGTGNFTEQYGVLCTSAALLFTVKYSNTKQVSHLFVSAFFLGLAPWFKETFALSAIPYAIYFFMLAIKKTIHIKQMMLMLITALIPSAIMALLMAKFASWQGFAESLQYSFSYISSKYQNFFQLLWSNRTGTFYYLLGSVFIGFLCCIPGFVSLLTPKWGRGISLLITGQIIADYVATALSGNYFSHYYIQTTPIIILVICMGMVWLSDRLKTSIHFNISPALLCGIFLLGQYQWGSYAGWRTNPEKRYFDAISRYLNQREPHTPRHIALGSSDLGFYLPQAGGISNLRHAVPYPYHWFQLPGETKRIRCKMDSTALVTHPPSYIIYNGNFSEFIRDGNMDAYINNHYHEVCRTQLRKDFFAILLENNSAQKNQ